jgi:hypothetical protein
MSKLQISAALMCLALGGALCATRASADSLTGESSRVTFSGPVDIPGRVLPAGTYEFKVLDNSPTSDLQTVEVLNNDGSHAIALLRTVPVSRPVNPVDRNGRSEVLLEQQGSNAPEAVKEWFADGDSRGHEFVYPNHKTNNENEPLAQTVVSGETTGK